MASSITTPLPAVLMANNDTDASLRHMPVAMLTTSINEADTHHTYALGANACITKPRSTHEIRTVLGLLSRHWPEMV